MTTPFDDLFTQLGKKLAETVSVNDFGAKGGQADDTAKIQAAMNSGASRIIFPADSYCFSQITIPPTVHAIVGNGPGATFLNCIGTLANYQPWIYFNAIAGIEFAGFSITQAKTPYALNHALNFGSCTDGNIHNLRFNEAGFFAVYMAGCSIMDVSGVTVAGHANSAITSELNGQKITIKDCKILSDGTGHSIAVAGGAGHDISGNFINGAGPGSFGISIGGSDSIVSKNRVIANHREGINLQDASRVSILDNIVNCESWHADFGISIYAANSPVESCVVSGNRTYNSGSAGIGVASTNFSNAFCRYNRISDNLVMNPCQAGAEVPAEARAGITLYGPQTAGNVVQANTTIDQAGNMRYGVAEWDDSLGAPSYNSFIHNHAPIGSGLVEQAHILDSTSRVWNLG